MMIKIIVIIITVIITITKILITIQSYDAYSKTYRACW
jgi:hypothetical protein